MSEPRVPRVRAAADISQFPVKDVKELEAQLLQIQEQLHELSLIHI